MTWELLTNKEMALADKITIEGGTEGHILMERAGEGVADEILQTYSDCDNFLVLCGPGNNGGDGFVVARHLKDDNRSVTVLLLGSVEDLSGDAKIMADKWDGDITALSPDNLKKELEENTAENWLIVDSIFGAGLSRELDESTSKCVNIINNSDLSVVSIDIPSGVCGDSGAIRGAAIVADMTVTFFRCKPGHYLLPGRELCGDLRLVDIGIQADVFDKILPSCIRNDLAVWEADLPRLTISGHKYNRGHAVVISGPVHRTGAARLGAMAALRSGSGLVTVFSPKDAVVVNACHLTSIMLEPYETTEDIRTLLQDRRKNAVLIGPGAGVGNETKQNVHAILESRAEVVLDADALTSFQEKPDTLFQAIKSLTPRTVVLTPHDGEFGRLFGDISHSSKVERARIAAELSGAVIVLKGADTVIASPDGKAAINYNAPPWLATAGSGDVLAGVITGLLAQGMPGYEAACAGVWLHGEAAEFLGPNLIAECLPENIQHTINSILDPDP